MNTENHGSTADEGLRHDETVEQRLIRALRGLQATIGQQAMYIGALEAHQLARARREAVLLELMRQMVALLETEVPAARLPSGGTEPAAAGEKSAVVVPLRPERDA